MTVPHASATEPRGPADPLSPPFITIAIPTFNRSALLKRCLITALAQSYRNFEIVVSNNASPDDTEAVLAEFTDSRLRVVRQDENIGLLPNWNACLAHARGEFVVFLSDDDRVSPWFLERCAELIEKRPDVPVVITLSNLHSGALGRTKPACVSRNCATGIVEGTSILKEFLADQITVTMCGVLMRTELLRANGGIPLDLPHMADIAAWAPLLFLGPVGFVNEACATFTYQHSSETSRLGADQLLIDGGRIVDLIRQRADAHVAATADQHRINALAQSCFARRGLIALADERRAGGSMSDVVSGLWRFRRDFTGLDLRSVIRFVATVISPEMLMKQFRQRRSVSPEHLA